MDNFHSLFIGDKKKNQYIDNNQISFFYIYYRTYFWLLLARTRLIYKIYCNYY